MARCGRIICIVTMMEYFSLTVADVDTELTCPAQADVTRDQTTGWGITQH